MQHETVTLNAEQSYAVQAILDFLQDPDPQSRFFVFSGSAGTGKTFCMREVIARLKGSRINVAYTAPTNKAAKVLREITGSAGTIYSLLGLRIDKSGELKQLVAGKPPQGLADLDAVFLDEASMVNKNLMKELQAAAERYDFRVIFLGDAAQLPPVKELHSPIWDLPTGATLTQVMRHDNQILSLVVAIRDVINHPAPSITLASAHDTDGGVWKMSKPAFKEAIFQAAARGDFADGSAHKVIAWRNVKVAEYNDLIRYAIYGAQAQSVQYLPGERIVAAAPCERADETLLSTDEEAVVESVTECKHPLEPRYRALELRCTSETGKPIRLLVLHPESRVQYDRDCQDLAHQAATNGKLWKKFWNLKDLFHDIRYAYAITAHRSQGSTYENVWVDYQDILSNRTRREAFQCLYVAATRPTTRLYLA